MSAANLLQDSGLIQDALQLRIVIDHERRPRILMQRLFKVGESARRPDSGNGLKR